MLFSWRKRFFTAPLFISWSYFGVRPFKPHLYIWPEAPKLFGPMYSVHCTLGSSGRRTTRLGMWHFGRNRNSPEFDRRNGEDLLATDCHPQQCLHHRPGFPAKYISSTSSSSSSPRPRPSYTFIQQECPKYNFWFRYRMVSRIIFHDTASSSSPSSSTCK